MTQAASEQDTASGGTQGRARTPDRPTGLQLTFATKTDDVCHVSTRSAEAEWR